MAPKFKVQTFFFVFGDHVFCSFRASWGKFGQVWQKWYLKCALVKKIHAT